MKFSMKKIAAAVIATGGLLAMGTQAAWAVPTFTIDSSAIMGGAPDLHTGDFFKGSSSELLTTAGGGHTGSGWLQMSSLDLTGSAVYGFGNLGAYGLYVSFTLADTYSSGGTGINTAGSINTLSMLDFKVYADPQKNNVFTPANALTSTNATFTNGADDLFLGFGSLISGTSGFNANGGAYLNSTNSFSLCTGAGTATTAGAMSAGCTDGKGVAFFVDPVPFYNLVFTEFNNTAQGILTNGNLTSVTNASGGLDFNNQVPEPGMLALLGLGLAGLGIAKRRKMAAK